MTMLYSSKLSTPSNLRYSYCLIKFFYIQAKKKGELWKKITWKNYYVRMRKGEIMKLFN